MSPKSKFIVFFLSWKLFEPTDTSISRINYQIKIENLPDNTKFLDLEDIEADESDENFPSDKTLKRSRFESVPATRK